MSKPQDAGKGETPFLSVEDAEIVHGPDVIAGKVSSALRDADRFGLPHVKPPLTEALAKVEGPSSSQGDPAGGMSGQDALAGEAAAVEGDAGSADHLKLGAETPAS